MSNPSKILSVRTVSEILHMLILMENHENLHNSHDICLIKKTLRNIFDAKLDFTWEPFLYSRNLEKENFSSKHFRSNWKSCWNAIPRFHIPWTLRISSLNKILSSWTNFEIMHIIISMEKHENTHNSCNIRFIEKTTRNIFDAEFDFLWWSSFVHPKSRKKNFDSGRFRSNQKSHWNVASQFNVL